MVSSEETSPVSIAGHTQPDFHPHHGSQQFYLQHSPQQFYQYEQFDSRQVKKIKNKLNLSTIIRSPPILCPNSNSCSLTTPTTSNNKTSTNIPATLTQTTNTCNATTYTSMAFLKIPPMPRSCKCVKGKLSLKQLIIKVRLHHQCESDHQLQH